MIYTLRLVVHYFPVQPTSHAVVLNKRVCEFATHCKHFVRDQSWLGDMDVVATVLRLHKPATTRQTELLHLQFLVECSMAVQIGVDLSALLWRPRTCRCCSCANTGSVSPCKICVSTSVYRHQVSKAWKGGSTNHCRPESPSRA